MQGSCSSAVPAVVGHHNGCTSTTAWLPVGNQRSGYMRLTVSFMTLWWYNKIWTILVQVATERITYGPFTYFVIGYLLWSLLLQEPSVTFSTCCFLFYKNEENITAYFLSTFSFYDQFFLLHFCLYWSNKKHYFPRSPSVFPPCNKDEEGRNYRSSWTPSFWNVFHDVRIGWGGHNGDLCPR